MTTYQKLPNGKFRLTDEVSRDVDLEFVNNQIEAASRIETDARTKKQRWQQIKTELEKL